MANFYKMDPAVWDATTAALSLEEEAAYLRICNAIYKAERGCPDLPRVLAGMFRCSTRKARSLVESLVEKGKVYRRDGVIWNDKAEREIRAIQDKKGGQASAKGSRTDDETAAKGSRVEREPDANQPRNNDEPPHKSLKEGETSNGDDPPRLEKKRKDESRKDSKEIAFEGFWKSYPRRRQECGSLTKGSKQAARKQWGNLPADERQLAIDGLPGFSRMYPDDSKAVCDAERYLSKKRWLDVEGIDEKPADFIAWPKGWAGEKARELDHLIGRNKFKSWFIRDGVVTLTEISGRRIRIEVASKVQHEMIMERFLGAFVKVFGRGQFEVVVREKEAA